MQTCSGICSKYRATKPHKIGVGRYEVGQKRCITCEEYVYWDGKHCPCCCGNLRTGPRKSRDKKRLRLVLGIAGTSMLARKDLENDLLVRVHAKKKI